jgi:hypothetical protein
MYSLNQKFKINLEVADRFIKDYLKAGYDVEIIENTLNDAVFITANNYFIMIIPHHLNCWCDELYMTITDSAELFYTELKKWKN